jgi:hypothetical protein
MDVLKEQRVCVKFCQKLGKTATETYEMLQQAFGETALSRSQTFEWYSRFKNGRTSIDDDPHTGRPSAARTNETVDHINAVIRGNRRLTIREIADELNVSFGTFQAILTQDLGMRRVSAKLVPGFSHKIRQNTVPVVPYPPYSPGLAPCYFFLFPRLKSTVKGKRFQDVAEIQLNTTRQLQAVPKQAYQTCIEKWKDRWNRCMQSGGSYFEGNSFE